MKLTNPFAARLAGRTAVLASIITFSAFFLAGCAKSPPPQSGPDYTAYLFASFRGNGEDGLHLAYSRDGLNWIALNNDNAVLTPDAGTKLMRDPTLIRGPESFHMVWTTGWEDKGIGIAHSDDLVTWSDQQFVPVMSSYPAAKNAWAPEIYYDETEQEFVIFWASTLAGKYPQTEAQADKGWDHRIYATRTKDFAGFTPTTLFYQPDFNVIDANITALDSGYVMLVKDETRHPAAKRLHTAFSDNINGPWRFTESSFSPDSLWVEGPTTLKVKDGFMVYYDAYMTHRFGAMFTRDFIHFEDKTPQLNLPAGTRHGSAIPITEEELQTLLNAYGDDTTHWSADPLKSVCSGVPLTCKLGGGTGNYQVAVTGTLSSDIYAESRRKMFTPAVASEMPANPGSSTAYFAVNVRAPEGQPIQDVSEPSTDGLNLTFMQPLNTISSIEVTPMRNSRSLFIIGDSTVCDQTPQWSKASEDRYTGWGQQLPAWFAPSLTVINYADSGEGTEAFAVPDGVLWQKMAGQIQPDDWVLIQLGHNDKKTPKSVYVSRLTGLLETIQGKGAHPVVISPMIRNHNIPLTQQHIYGDLVLRDVLPEITTSANVPYIDLMSLSHDWANRLGQAEAQTYFVDDDQTHSNEHGAGIFAQFIVDEISRQQSDLASYLRVSQHDKAEK